VAIFGCVSNIVGWDGEMHRKYFVRLTKEEREQLKEIVTKGETSAYKIKHANVLLKADLDGPAWPDWKIAEAFSIHPNTVSCIKQHFVTGRLERAISRKKQEYQSNPPKFDGEVEAKLIAISCSKPPEGRNRWTLRLLADRVIVLEIMESVSPETIRNVLKKTNLSHTVGKNG
jgi:Homeodomain-like domain